MIEPIGCFDTLLLRDRCRADFTDSGGLQKEAYFSKKPCITLRDETEWVELVESGWNMPAGADRKAINVSENKVNSFAIEQNKAFYGNGAAGSKILETIIPGGCSIAGIHA